MPKRRPQDDASTPHHADVGNSPKTEPRFDQLDKLEAHDRQMHIQKGLEAGLTREQAEKHADEDHKDWSPKHVEARAGSRAPANEEGGER